MTTPNDNRKSFKVSKGNTHVTVYPYRGGWRFAWRARESEPWKYITRPKKAEATAAAENKLDEIETGGVIWSALPAARRRFLEAIHRDTRQEDEASVLVFIAARQKSTEVVDSVARFLAWKVAKKGEETRNLGNVRRNLEPMALHFAGRTVTDITADDLAEWWKSRCGHLKSKTRNEIRGSLVSFWNWCTLAGLFPKEVTAPADLLPRADVGKHDRRVLTPAEFKAVASAILPQFRASIVLQAFCGFRPEEVAPPKRKGMSKKSKRGIRREEIDWQANIIRVPEEVTKTGFPRNVPLLPAAREWLEWAGVRPGQTGPVCDNNPVEAGETARLGREVFKTGWPQDALRHSYGSYRNAMIRALPQVAEEMGTSEAMLRKHYHNPKTREEGEAWFGLLTTDLIRQEYDKIEVSAQTFLDAISMDDFIAGGQCTE
jgi:integrase